MYYFLENLIDENGKRIVIEVDTFEEYLNLIETSKIGYSAGKNFGQILNSINKD